MKDALSRRRFLLHGFTGVSAAWVTTHWPAVLAAVDHAHAAARSATPPKFEFLTPEQGAEIDAITARIIPTDETPGAREAGVVYFIDRALKTFASDFQKNLNDGLPELQARAREMYPSIQKFSAATPEQQDAILHSLDQKSPAVERPFRSRHEAQDFFETLRSLTIHGFLIDPDSDTGGNRDGVGWKVIGREREHMFQPPFGFYDKDYPGWQPLSKDAEKK
jgi:gluconate 2-dehydrogenase subunit 3-like protein